LVAESSHALVWGRNRRRPRYHGQDDSLLHIHPREEALMAPIGYFTFVLHSHMPYVRQAGRWPFGEETLHEVMAETYVPLLNAIYELKDEGVSPYLTVGLTPILLEQLADPLVLEHFELYLEQKLQLANLDIARHEASGAKDLLNLAHFYQRWYEHVIDSFTNRYQRDLVGAFRKLREEGNLDILTGAATHGYLPLMERDSTIHGQLATGMASSRRHMGAMPSGVWLPECGYRPAYYKDGRASYLKPGIESFLNELSLQYFFTDTNVITGGEMVGKVAGDAIGPYGRLPKRKLAVVQITEPTEKTTFRPYYVAGSPVGVYGRDERTGMQVWSAAHGYPGDFHYREFHRKDDNSGLQYWRVTGAKVDLGRKELYSPERAQVRAHEHADHFVSVVVERLAEYHKDHDVPGIIVSAYDTELYGHWWFEGIDWMKDVLRQFAKNADVKLCTAASYAAAHPPTEVLNLRESSWGSGGGHWTWMNPETEWMWPLVHAAERRMERLAERYPQAEGDMLALLAQVARELVLLESSDWPFLVSTGQAKDYAINRFQGHLARFSQLAALAESGGLQSEADRRALLLISEMDNPFPQIDYRSFVDREAIGSRG
jgi:1,4-alpha-glucan branching enzyme